MIIRRADANKMRKELKAQGYNIKTSTLTNEKVMFNVFQNSQWLFGSDANVYPKEVLQKHRKAFDITKRYRIR